jgi:hypothetical protein
MFQIGGIGGLSRQTHHSLPILDPIAAKGAPAGQPLSFRWHAENSRLQACHNKIPHHLIGRLFLRSHNSRVIDLYQWALFSWHYKKTSSMLDEGALT